MKLFVHMLVKILFYCLEFNFFQTEFPGVTLVNKTIWVSDVQLNKTSSTYIMHSPSIAESLSVPIYPSFTHHHLPQTPFPSGYHHNVICVCVSHIHINVCVCVYLSIIYLSILSIYLNPFTFSPPDPTHYPLTAVSLFCVSMLLFLRCLFNYFVY